MEAAQASFQRTLIGHVLLSLKRRQNPFSSVLSKPTARKAKATAAVDLDKIRIAYSQLESPRTVSVLQ
jgi:hypothetical protein